MTRPEPSPPHWRKSSYSTSESDSMCVEVASMKGQGIATRDSKDPNGPILHFTPDEWTTLLTRIKQDATR